MLIYSTPAPIPMSICPALILAAIVAQASIPLEQNLLRAIQVVVSGNPAKNSPILDYIAPEPGCRTFPTTMSFISFGSIFVFYNKPWKTVLTIISGGVSFYKPLFALVSGVLRAATITTSSGDLVLLILLT